MEARYVNADADGDHVYISGQADSGLFVSKLNKSDGTVDWRRQLGSVSPNNIPESIVIGSDGMVPTPKQPCTQKWIVVAISTH